jgi:diadenosine tetraphosphate (Ap4A) HIT family hydrolase
MTADCYACAHNALVDPPAREAIVSTDHWRVAHAFNSALRGWLVVVPRRHVVALHELTADEAAEIGPLLRSLSKALRDVTGCVKTYVMLFAEQAGFAHVHFHVVPRMSGFHDDQYGPEVFWFLKRPESEWLSADEMDRVAMSVRRALDES